MGSAGVLQGFPAAIPLPDLSFPISPVWCLGTSKGVNSVPVSLLGLCRGFTRTLEKGSACLKIKVAIKYLLCWPQELVNVMLKQNICKAINLQGEGRRKQWAALTARKSWENVFCWGLQRLQEECAPQSLNRDEVKVEAEGSKVVLQLHPCFQHRQHLTEHRGSLWWCLQGS